MPLGCDSQACANLRQSEIMKRLLERDSSRALGALARIWNTCSCLLLVGCPPIFQVGHVFTWYVVLMTGCSTFLNTPNWAKFRATYTSNPPRKHARLRRRGGAGWWVSALYCVGFLMTFRRCTIVLECMAIFTNRGDADGGTDFGLVHTAQAKGRSAPGPLCTSDVQAALSSHPPTYQPNYCQNTLQLSTRCHDQPKSPLSSCSSWTLAWMRKTWRHCVMPLLLACPSFHHTRSLVWSLMVW